MRFRLIVLPALAALLASCGKDKDAPPLMNSAARNPELAGSLYSEAQAADKDGKRSKAIKLYDKLADTMPTSVHAAESRFRQGELLEQEGEIQKSFEAYQDFLSRYNNSLYCNSDGC